VPRYLQTSKDVPSFRAFAASGYSLSFLEPQNKVVYTIIIFFNLVVPMCSVW